MNLDLIKKIAAIIATIVPASIGLASLAMNYLDARYVGVKTYEDRVSNQERLLQHLRIDASIQILENKRTMLEEKLIVLTVCEQTRGCRLQDSIGVARERTVRELQDVRNFISEWKKQKNTPS